MSIPYTPRPPNVGFLACQTHFCLEGRPPFSNVSLTALQTSALRDAVALAIELVSCPRGREATSAILSAPTGPLIKTTDTLPSPIVPVPNANHPTIDDWLASNECQVIVDVRLQDYALMDTENPNDIRVQYDLVVAAGNALKGDYMEAYTAHIIHLAIVLAHKVQHSIQYHQSVNHT
ncbi:hypothetical protein M231_02032 [Tremella mesenterica]|uniref:Uncharacterized protein n=1 Tax=Tremella mesenterica TaxID=5217 RepID=A0A4V1M4J4_TREME|nr:hypothetical protein M231_02032 [Tremella mesenterica]